MPLLSKIDSSIELSRDNWAISLVRNGQHAVIIWEKINPDGDYELWKSDLVKAGHANSPEDYYHKNYAMLDNTIYDGSVRKQELIGAVDMSKTAIYEKFHLSKGIIKWIGITWECPAIRAQNMEQAINASVKNPPKFHIGGKGFNQNNAHNCITWAEEMLQAAELEVQHGATSNCIESLSSRAITSLRVC